ncbi:MAG: alpha-mannosidase [Inquilinaceae bacterium]
MRGRWPFVAEKIATRLKLIEPFIFRRRQPLPHFRLLPLSEAMVDAPICADPTGWEEVPHQSYWGHADLNFVLKSSVTVPDGWDREHLALHLPLGVLGDIFNHPEALVRVDTRIIGSADRYHHTVPLDAAVADGQVHLLSLHGWTGHVGWPPDSESKARLFMGIPSVVERDAALLAFHGLARAVLDTISVLDHESAEHQGLLRALDHAFNTLDTRDPIGEALYASVPAAQRTLTDGIAAAGEPLDVTLHAIGHAHMDVAYLWPISQIRLKNARTCSNVLRLMEDDPDYHFSHSQPQLYAMTAQDYPDLFERIRARVAEGRWEVMGGMWVEPDLNIPGPEALIRQLMLGRRYFRETFGDVETPVLWLPDTFGFPAQVPQLMRLAGLKWFVTNKLNWNQRNKVPSSSHVWEGIDGSRVIAHILTTPRDVQYLPFPTNYKSDLSAAEVLGTWTNSTAQDHVRDLPICFGYGDGGGGPTEELLAKAHAYSAMPAMPRLRLSTVRETFERIEACAADLPVWTGEHYVEGHRGVFTSQGWIKRANRKAEWALHEAEALSAMAGLAADLTDAWRLLCLNQFHDIITGTSVPEVFADARLDYDTIVRRAEAVSRQAAQLLSGQQIRVASTSPVTGPRLVFVEGSQEGEGQAVDGGTLHFVTTFLSYSVLPLSEASSPETPSRCRADGFGAILENAHLCVHVAGNGQLTRVHDKAAGVDVLPTGHVGNQLQAFEDRPICWDAWDIDPSFEDRQETVTGTHDLEIVETGPIRAAVRVTTRWRNSILTQTIRLAAHSRRIDFVTEVDWHETHTLLKAAFPTVIDAPLAQFDVQWGVVERSTKRDTPFDAARFEVPAHKWAQLSDERYAVALLNDCKYGYDVTRGMLRITLIKSSTSPDPKADQGRHVFTYSLLPLPNADRAVLNAEAYDLNAPLRILAATANPSPPSRPFVTSRASNVIVETLKPADDGDGIVIRMNEAEGRPTSAVLEIARPVLSAERVDFDEQPIAALNPSGSTLRVEMRPFEIATVRLRLDG